MKNFSKKILSFVLVLAMLLSFASTAFAQEEEITLLNEETTAEITQEETSSPGEGSTVSEEETTLPEEQPAEPTQSNSKKEDAAKKLKQSFMSLLFSPVLFVCGLLIGVVPGFGWVAGGMWTWGSLLALPMFFEALSNYFKTL